MSGKVSGMSDVTAQALMRGSCWRRAMAASARSPVRRLGGGGASSLRNVTASLPVLEGLSTVVATGRWRRAVSRVCGRRIGRSETTGVYVARVWGQGTRTPHSIALLRAQFHTHAARAPPPPLRRLACWFPLVVDFAWPGVYTLPKKGGKKRLPTPHVTSLRRRGV